jgi:hypothetical protein
MNRDEMNSVLHTASANPFASQGPAVRQLKTLRAPTGESVVVEPRWEPGASNLAPETPLAHENAPKVEFQPVKPTVEPEIQEEISTLKTLKSPTKASIKKAKAPNPVHESRTPEGLPSYRCEFEGRDIMLGFPCYKTTNPVTMATVVAMAMDFGREKFRFDMEIGDAMVYHARNRIAAKFLDTDAKWLLMMDDDIIPSIGRPGWMRAWVTAARSLQDNALQRHVLHRLIGSGKTLIGGAYFGRQEGGALMCSDLSLASRVRNYEDAVVPVDWVATGCMMVHRTVFEDIQKKFPELAPKKQGDVFDFFHPMSSGEGEDVSFCKRAKQAEHQPHIDLGLPVFHVGYKVY